MSGNFEFNFNMQPHYFVTQEMGEEKYAKDTLEYILSREHISVYFPDVFKNQDENQDVFVDLDQLINLPLVSPLIHLLEKLLKESKKFSLDEVNRKVIVHMNNRTTIMLRDIPRDISREELNSLFGEWANYIIEVRPEIEDNYYIDFKSSSITQSAFAHVRQQTYRGKNVGGCIKTNYNFYSPPQMYFPQTQEHTFVPEYIDYSNDSDQRKRGRGRGRKYSNSRNRPPSHIKGVKKNDSPFVNIQDLGSESFPPLKSNVFAKREQADKKYSIEQVCDIVGSIEEVLSPEFVNTSSEALSETPNFHLELGRYSPNTKVEWVTKQKNGASVKKEEVKNVNVNEHIHETRVKHWKVKEDHETLPQTDHPNNFSPLPRYADIVKQNSEQQLQPKTSPSAINTYKGTFTVVPKKEKKQNDLTSNKDTTTLNKDTNQESQTTETNTNKSEQEQN